MLQADLLTRSATIQPQSFNEANRTVRVTWSTGAAVPRRDQHGAYSEVLSLDPLHVSLDRLRGASVLDTHQQRGLRDVIGVVDAAGLDAGAGWADVRFSSRPEVQPVVEDVKAGVIRHVSVGYSVQRWLDAKDPSTGGRTRTAIAWTPQEISFVPLPADPGANVRSNAVPTETDTTTTTPASTDDTGNRAAVNTAIRTIATTAALGATWADGLIDTAATVEQARAAAFEELVRRGGTSIRTQRAEVGTGSDDPAVQVQRMGEALVARLNPTVKPSDAARPYMALGLVEMARTCLQLRGERVGMVSREEILQRAMATTSDFPNLLTSTGNRVLMMAYEAAPNPLKALARQGTIADFRPKSLLRLGDLPKLKKVNEQGEIKHSVPGEAREGYSLETFGTIFSLTRKAIINDDLGAFNEWSVIMGRASAETEADQLVQLLLQGGGNGPVMSDGKRLFAPEHGNLAGAGASPVVSALTDGRVAMRNQKGLDGTTPINATPKYLLVGSALETVAEQLLTSIYAQTPVEANPFIGRLTPLVEPRLPPTAWYLFTDPASLPVLEFSYLTSAPGPQLATRQGWDVLGMEFRCILDFGCGAIDWRGAYRNAGA